MYPTQTQLHSGRWGYWSQVPPFHYSMKSSLSFPDGPHIPTEFGSSRAAAGNAAHSAVESGVSGAMSEGVAGAGGRAHLGGGGVSGGGGYPPKGPGMWSHTYRAEYPHHLRRGWRGMGVMKRFIWFGIGATAATWYIRSKEDKARRQVDHLPTEGNNRFSPTTTCRSYPPVLVAPPVPQSVAATSQPFPSSYDAHTQTHSPTLAAISEPKPTDTKERPEVEHSKGRQWGWGAHRRARREDKAKADSHAYQMEGSSTFSNDGDVSKDGDEMTKMKEAFENLWEERKREARVAQSRASQQARDYAREKLETLSLAVETLRESLNREEETAGKAETNRKLV